MTTVIVDSCQFTQHGLSAFINSLGVDKGAIHVLDTHADMVTQIHQIKPSVVFISEECFDFNQTPCERLKQLITDCPDTLFCIFMSISNTRFEEYLCVRDNIFITSKSVKYPLLEKLVRPYLKLTHHQRRHAQHDLRPLVLSKTESDMLRMWMNGNDTIQISDKMQIKAKTISSHKGNIKRKIKTHNKQVIYHVVKLADSLTSGLFVNLRNC